MTDATLEARLFVKLATKQGDRRVIEPRAAVHLELKRKHVTRSILWVEYIVIRSGAGLVIRLLSIRLQFCCKLLFRLLRFTNDSVSGLPPASYRTCSGTHEKARRRRAEDLPAGRASGLISAVFHPGFRASCATRLRASANLLAASFAAPRTLSGPWAAPHWLSESYSLSCRRAATGS
jgi:hypothetical protein